MSISVGGTEQTNQHKDERLRKDIDKTKKVTKDSQLLLLLPKDKDDERQLIINKVKLKK